MPYGSCVSEQVSTYDISARIDCVMKVSRRSQFKWRDVTERKENNYWQNGKEWQTRARESMLWMAKKISEVTHQAWTFVFKIPVDLCIGDEVSKTSCRSTAFDRHITHKQASRQLFGDIEAKLTACLVHYQSIRTGARSACISRLSGRTLLGYLSYERRYGKPRIRP